MDIDVEDGAERDVMKVRVLMSLATQELWLTIRKREQKQSNCEVAVRCFSQVVEEEQGLPLGFGGLIIAVQKLTRGGP